MSTVKWFIIIVIAFILIFLILAGGRNPFSFGDAYFRPRASLNPFPSPSFTSLPENAQPTETETIDVEVGNGVTIDR